MTLQFPMPSWKQLAPVLVGTILIGSIAGCRAVATSLDDLAQLAGRTGSSTRTVIKQVAPAADEAQVLRIADESVVIFQGADDTARAAAASEDDVVQLRALATDLACDLYSAYPDGLTVDEVENIVVQNGWLAQVPSANAREFAGGALNLVGLMQDKSVDAIDVACAL